MQKPNLHIMRAAIEVAEKHKSPFGAALSMGDEIFVTAANQTGSLHDPTAHAEIMAIRKLGQHLQKTDFSGFTLYSTCEPCPMCMGAAIWAKIDAIFFGSDIATISTYMAQIDLTAESINQKSFRQPEIKGGVLKSRTEQLLKLYG